MKYHYKNQAIPQEARKDINNKILHLIETGDLQGLSHEDIYNAYTGDGGLHGLNFKDFSSFHSYTEAKKDLEAGQFFTPHSTSIDVVDILNIDKNDLVADLTCGSGSFFNFLPNLHNAYGCDIDSKATRVARFLYPEASIKNCDIRAYEPKLKFDTLVLNPPFNLDFGGMSSQMYVCQKSAELMKPLAIMALIVPKSFLNDEMMNKQDIERMNEFFNFIGQYPLSNNEFKQMGVDNFATKVMFFQRKSEHVSDVSFVNEFTTKDDIKNKIEVLRKIKSSLRAKTMTEIKSDDSEFEYKVRKYLYEFRTHKNLQYYYAKAQALIEKFNTQKRPDGMEWEEWDKIKLTKNKVLATFKRVMSNSAKVQKDVIRVIKKGHSFEIKAYSNKSKQLLSKKVNDSTIVSIYQLVTMSGEYEKYLNVCKSLNLDTTELKKVVNRKIKDYLLHNCKLTDLQIDKKVNSYVNRFSFISKGQRHKLNEIQKEDVKKVLTRKHTLLSWVMGGGKSVALLCASKYLTKNNLTKNVFITAPAIALDLTLKNTLKTNGVNYIEILKADDLNKIKEGQVVLITLGRLRNLKDEVKEFVKSRSNKVSLIFDESDEVKNRLSKRSRAVLNAFRRCHRTILMTGTPTRNNLNEIYPNIELMYNNSYNMMCNVQLIYKQDKKTKEIKSHINKKRFQPFDAYYGFGTFKSCFAPSKASVFGIQKELQDLYNLSDLTDIINSSIITRTMEELMGDKKEMISHFVQPNYAEKVLQQDILERFHEMCYNYFQSTGNSRKESYLRIIRMINLLIKSTTSPHLMKEWIGEGLPTKYAKVIKMIEERPNEQILVGCVGIESTESYFNHIKKTFPNREVIYVDGTISFKKRGQIIEHFNNTDNAIIVANQASLKSSVNIPECNTVIIPSLPWNNSSLAQFYCRTIRFDSKNKTQVHLICYSESIDLNILNLILNKEKVNNFVKTTEVSTEEDVNEEFGVDGDILGSLIQKHYDEEGGMRLSWGEKSKRVE
ncbi:helicase [Tenacibaculum phage pT24]|uniref:Helicase n=1 Tax=Tenacibaculum phage pT24 TaxID=1880590 RepID=A0A1W7GKP2_9CAUD|nr:helicase [Tenacibaculum phage pT24]BAX25548.1 helicase [Tenacibaculum phage pT24]